MKKITDAIVHGRIAIEKTVIYFTSCLLLYTMLFLGLIWLKLLDKETLQSTAPALLLMFHLQQCELCGLSSVLRQYPATPDYCVHCSQLRCKEKISTVLKVLKSGFDHFCSDPAVMLEALFHRINIPIDLVSCEVISSFLVPSIRQVQFEHSRAARYEFLKNTLLAHGSIFRNFTYFSGGMAGNISTCEDVLDRILIFLVHTREYANAHLNPL